jgi:hypothetical protein
LSWRPVNGLINWSWDLVELNREREEENSREKCENFILYRQVVFDFRHMRGLVPLNWALLSATLS